MSSNSASGPDGFPAIPLKSCKQELAGSFRILFQSFLATGKLPRKLKESIIYPIHKSGCRAEIKNFRSISAKTEWIIRKKLIAFMEESDLLNDTQRGFCSDRSCLTQLLQYYGFVLKQRLGHSDVNVIHLDFAKAFNKADHGMVCQKLWNLGIAVKLGLTAWLHKW